MHFIKTHF